MRRRETWWRQKADQKYLSAILEDILATKRERRWESRRRGEGGGGGEEVESNSGRNGHWYVGTETREAPLGE